LKVLLSRRRRHNFPKLSRSWPAGQRREAAGIFFGFAGGHLLYHIEKPDKDVKGSGGGAVGVESKHNRSGIFRWEIMGNNAEAWCDPYPDPLTALTTREVSEAPG
jgi:hypothetical protein